jgi:hypothetical protein
MGWFKGKFTGKPPYLMGTSMVSCRFSIKPMHCLQYMFTKSYGISMKFVGHGLQKVDLHGFSISMTGLYT